MSICTHSDIGDNAASQALTTKEQERLENEFQGAFLDDLMASVVGVQGF